jgi:hypothetical protein
MPVVVKFNHAVLGSPHPGDEVFGPYRVVQIKGDALLVFNGLNPFRLATRLPDGQWEPDGFPGWSFGSVVIQPPDDVSDRELEDALEGDD